MKARLRSVGNPAVGDEAGSALMMALLVTLMIGGLSTAMLVSVTGAQAEQGQANERLRSQYVAEAALNAASIDLYIGGDGVLGSAQDPVAYGASSYWVEVTDLGNGRHGLVANGSEGRSSTRMEMVVVSVEGESTPDWGVFGDEWVQLDANTLVDSYDSRLGSYASQRLYKEGSLDYALQNARLGSNGDVGMASNTIIFGSATVGPTGALSGTVDVRGDMTTATELLVMPDVEVTTHKCASSFSIKNASTELAPGNYDFGSFSVRTKATVTIVGPAVVTARSFEVYSNASVLCDTTNGPVVINVEDDFEIYSNASLRPVNSKPEDLEVNLASGHCDTVVINSNSELVASLLAPYALVDIDSNSHLYGTVFAGRLRLNSNSGVHVDEAMTETGESTPSLLARWGFSMPESGTGKHQKTATEFRLVDEESELVGMVDDTAMDHEFSDHTAAQIELLK